MRTIILAAAAFLAMAVFSNIPQAETTDCAVHYTRTACTGQEATSYKKCDGNQSCVKYKKADSLEACQQKAMKSCRNRRLNITKTKVITARWQGAAIKAPGGAEDFCQEYPKKNEEFNKCDQ
jgi:hypothetical protein